MWILPKNYPLSSHFAQDMVESKEDLNLPGLSIEQSLMSRSKPTRLRTWQTRWKEGSYYPHLFGRILKPCQWSLFETKLTSLLAAIHVNHSVEQESDLERKTQDTCGLTSGDTLNQLDLFGVSLKTSKDILVLDSEKSLATWKASVTKQRGEYSVRVKLAHLTKEKESISWATPNTMDHLPQRSEEALVRQATTQRKGRTKPANLREQVNPTAVAIYQEPTSWPTATVFDVTGGCYPTELVNGQWRSKHSKDPNSPWYGAKLRDAVETAERMNWPTPSTRDYKGGISPERTHQKLLEGKRAHMGALDNRVAYQAWTETGKKGGNLNPDWVEWLMGVPTGWTELGSWETELCHKQPLKHGSRSTKDLRH